MQIKCHGERQSQRSALFVTSRDIFNASMPWVENYGAFKNRCHPMARLAGDLYGGGFEEEELQHRYNDNFMQKKRCKLLTSSKPRLFFSIIPLSTMGLIY